MKEQRYFAFYYWFVGWHHLSFGFHVDLKSPNIEIHLPFGFLKFGFEYIADFSKKKQK